MTVLDVKGNIDSRSKKDVDELLIEEGFVWIKNSGITSPEEFNAQQQTFINKPMDYMAGTAVRETVKGSVLTTNKISSESKLFLHQEMAYAIQFPSRIVFYCQSPAGKGGQSLVADMGKISDDLPKDLFGKLVREKCVFKQFFIDKFSQNPAWISSLRCWQDAYATDDKAHAEEKARTSGEEVTWYPNDIMGIKKTLSNTLLTNKNRAIFFNNILEVILLSRSDYPIINKKIQNFEFLHEHGYRWEDGSAISESETQHLVHAYAKNEQVLPLAAGDILVVDNLRCAHGRMPYEGERKQFVLLGDPRTRQP